MSVLIKGMKMPKTCAGCEWYRHDDDEERRYSGLRAFCMEVDDG